jgi:hypothetical protein
MALELDRSNLTQAVTDNLLKELKMNTNGELLQNFKQFLFIKTAALIAVKIIILAIPSSS